MTQERPLRVFMTADAVGGVWQYALDLAGGLRRNGVETILAVLGPQPSDHQRADATDAGLQLVETDLPLDWTAATARELEQAGWALARMATEAEVDIVHLNSPALAAGILFPAPLVTVSHSCVATWWQAVRTGPLPEEFAWRADLVRRGYRASDAILAPTVAFAETTASVYGLSETPIVVRNGRKSMPRTASAGPEPFVFTAGRLWDDGKNVAALDRAAARLSIPVAAAGPLEGPNGARIELCHAQPLGMLSDGEIARHLSARPIFVSAARYEPFGLAVLEAAQAGCALVLSDIPTFRELWDGAAAFVPVGDDEAIANVVRHLVDDRPARERMGRIAQEWSQAYTVEAMCGGVLSVYQSLAASRTEEEAAA